MSGRGSMRAGTAGAAMLIIALMSAPLDAQGDRRFVAGYALGTTETAGGGTFSAAFNAGLGSTAILGYRLTSLVTLLGAFSYHPFEYDWTRLVPGRLSYQEWGGDGIPRAEALTGSLGVQLHPVRLGPFVPYADVGLAYLHRDGGSARLDVLLECRMPGFGRPKWEPPAYCEQALEETDFARRGFGLALGAGAQLAVIPAVAVFFQIEYLDDFSAGSAGLVPLRAGLALRL